MKRRPFRVKHWDDERDIGNSLIVTLAPGWCFSRNAHRPDDAEHVKGFDTVKEALAAVRNATACECSQCVPKPA